MGWKNRERKEIDRYKILEDVFQGYIWGEEGATTLAKDSRHTGSVFGAKIG